jgi:ribose 5-phosphate isomerase B
MPRTVFIASDHGGFALKGALVQALRQADCQVEDLGPECTGSCDYPLFADALCRRLLDAGEDGQNGQIDYPLFADALCRRLLDAGEDGQNGQILGILVCGTGLGMSMAANRHAGIRAAMCTCEFMARMARAHNNANVLCLGERVVGQGLAIDIAKNFLASNFEGGRHLRRIDLFDRNTK